MKRNYYLAIVKLTAPTTEYPLRIFKKGVFGTRYTFQLRNQSFYASRLSYPSALFLKFVSPLFAFKEQDGTVVKHSQVGQLVIRTTI